MSYPHGSAPIGDPFAATPGRPAAYAVGEGEGRLFLAVEVEVYRPGGAIAVAGWAHGEAPHAAPLPAAAAAADSEILRASDSGYVTPPGSLGGTLVYVPTLAQGVAVNRTLNLAPGGAGAAVAWGALRLTADARRYDAGVAGRNVDSRPVRLLVGRKRLDRSRGRYVDPPYASLAEAFAGLAQPWQPDETGLTIPVRDATVWLERPLQSSLYLGTGGIEGSADLAGRPRPKLRGGTITQPVRNVSPLQIDPIANIWQFSDAPAGIANLYEDGAAGFFWGGETADLWAGSTPAGYYRTDFVRGLFQLGSPTAGRITADVYGRFPVAGAVADAATIALRMLVEDLSLPAQSIDAASFTGLAAAYPWVAGWYWDGAADDLGADAVGLFLGSIGARLIPSRAGKLRAQPLRAIPAGTVPAATYTAAEIVNLRRGTLPPGASPPPHRLRWGYGRNHTVMDADVNPTVGEAQRAFLRSTDRFALWSSAAVLSAWRRPSDPEPIASALLDIWQAQAVVDAQGALWGEGRRLYSVELPLALGLRHDIGDALVIAFPLDDLDAGKLGQVVGEALRIGDATTTLQILV